MARNQVQFQKGLSEAGFAEICQYRLVFHVADYFRKIGAHLPDPPFIDGVSAEFAITRRRNTTTCRSSVRRGARGS